MSRFRIAAPAKTNLTLEVTDVLSDGSHALDTLFVWLGPQMTDFLLFEPHPGSDTRLAMVDDSNSPLDITLGPDNLILRAVRLLEQRCERALACDIRLEKRIPAGGGLGGGSADASATLVALNHIYQLGYTPQQLELMGAELGADVAFGVQGGLARGRGRGDQLQQYPYELKQEIIVACPTVGCPTGAIYQGWDRQPYRQQPGATENMLQALQEGKDWCPFICNDLAQAAMTYAPALQDTINRLRQIGCSHVFLSGSGSTLIGLATSAASQWVWQNPSDEQGTRYQVSRLESRPRHQIANVEKVD